MPNRFVSHHRTFRGFLLVIAFGFCVLSKPVFALAPEDILVVCNRNIAESKTVAEHYIKKRHVPAANIIELSLPTTESISRAEFNANLVPRLHESVTRLKKAGRPPAILLVYGIPLRINREEAVQNDKRQKHIQWEIETLGELVSNLTEKLAKLLATDEYFQEKGHPESESKPADVLSILQDARNTLIKAANFQKGKEKQPISGKAAQEIGSIIFRLAGISPIALGIQKQAVNEEESKSNLRNNELFKLAAILNIQLAQAPFRGVIDENIPDVASMVRVSRGLVGELAYWYGLKENDAANMNSASVDSELALILAEPYSKSRWLPNPFLDQFNLVPGIENIRGNTVMVSRLDGPTPEIAMRLVDDAVWAEEGGLNGIFYIDARGLNAGENADFYSQYDQHLRKLNEIVREKSSMKVVFDDAAELFPENSCPNAALYCGWYSLARYVDSFSWQRGAVGFHIASAEASTLKKAGSQVWCKRMLEEGVAATLGPVEEPYLQSFPLPDIFFPLLMTGKIPLIEVYYRSIPSLSWRQVLIGDPLYTPFMKQPAIDAD